MGAAHFSVRITILRRNEMYRINAVAMILLIGFLFGCSTSNVIPTTPLMDAPRTTVGDTSHRCWGLWEFTIDPSAKTLDVKPLRGADLHLNALPFLEPPMLVNITLESVVFNGDIIEVDIGLRHPFLGLTDFTGFDVCGVLISRGSIGGFNDPDILLPGPDDLRLLNPDGYTRWWNPSEFPVNDGTIFSYTDGLLGTPVSIANYTATLNGYKYFADELDVPDEPVSNLDPAGRGVFSAGQKNIRHYTIQMGSSGLVFNYAIDANWIFPTGGSPWEVPDDFGPGANRHEAWNAVVNINDNTLWNDGVDNGGDLSLSINVYDWFNAEQNLVTVESPGNFTAIVDAAPGNGGVGYSTFEIEIISATPAQDEIELLITAECEAVDYGGLLPGKTVASYFTTTVPVSDEEPQQGDINLVDITPPGWPATLSDVWIDHDYAYCSGNAGGLLILDISGTGDPTYVGGYKTDGSASELQVDGDYCYIADGGNGLVILDVSDPSDPQFEGSYPTSYDISGIHVVGGYCYTANGKGGVLVLDIGGGTSGGSPDNPVLEGSYAVKYAALDIQVGGGIAYVSDYETRFLVLDVGGGTQGGSPASPQLEAELTSIKSPDKIFYGVSFVYVSNTNPNQIVSIDIGNPSAPVVKDIKPTTYQVGDIWLQDDYLYTGQSNDGLIVYRISKSGYIDPEGSYNTTGYAYGVCLADNKAYVADYYYGLKVFDVTSHGNPVYLAKYFTPSQGRDIHVVDGYAYIADETCGMAIVDIGGGSASPGEPVCITRWTQPSGDRDVRGIRVDDGYAYLGGGWSNFHLTIADVGAGSGSPENPVAVGDSFFSGNRLYGIQRMGAYAYSAAYNINGGAGGLEVFDVDGGTMGGSPSNPQRTATISTNCTAWEVCAEDGYVYVACGQNSSPSGLYVYDAGGGTGQPNNPSLADYFATTEHLYDAKVLDGYAYVCGGGYGDHWMRVFDVGASTGAPDNIIEVGSYDFPTAVLVRGLDVMDGYVLLIPGQSDSSVVAIDVGGGQAGGSPSNPQLVDSLDLPSPCDAFCVDIDGQYAYVGAHSQGMRIIRLWD